MGNCSGICNSKIIKPKNDVLISNEPDTGNYYEQNDMKKIIYLQKFFRKYLKKIKTKKKIKLSKKLFDNNSKKRIIIVKKELNHKVKKKLKFQMTLL